MKRLVLITLLLCLSSFTASAQVTFQAVSDSIVLRAAPPTSDWDTAPIRESERAFPLSPDFPAMMMAPDYAMLDITIFSLLAQDEDYVPSLEPGTLMVAVSMLESQRSPDATAVETAQLWATTTIEESGETDEIEQMVLNGRDSVMFDAVIQGMSMRLVLIEIGRSPGGEVNQFGLVVALAPPDEMDDHTADILAIAEWVQVFDERTPTTTPAMAQETTTSCTGAAEQDGAAIELEQERVRLTAVLPEDWASAEAGFSSVFPAIMTAPDESMIDGEILRRPEPPMIDPGTVRMIVSLSDARNTRTAAAKASAAEIAQALASDFSQSFGTTTVEDDLVINGLPAAAVISEGETFSLYYLLVEVGMEPGGFYNQFGVVLTLAAPGEAADYTGTAIAIAETMCVFDEATPRY